MKRALTLCLSMALALTVALAVALAAPALAKSPPPAAAQGPEEPIEVQIKPSPTKAAPSKKAQDHFRTVRSLVAFVAAAGS